MTSRPYIKTGGLVFLTAALTLLLADQTTAWSIPRHLPRISVSHRHSNPISSALFSSPPSQPLAIEGDWAAYSDARYNRIYYFNHVTGESVWSKPSPTFPDVDLFAFDNNGFEDASDRAGQAHEQKPTLYQILNLAPTASRSEIKQSYLALAKTYHPDAVAKRNGDVEEGQRIFNDIARAWMVLSDEGLRRGYDESLGLNQDNVSAPGGQVEEGQSGGVRDAIIINKNKFEKNPVYKKKMEMDDGRNKFGRRVPPMDGSGGSGGQEPGRNIITTAPPLEIDYEAEAAASQSQGYYPPPPPLTASQATLLAQNAWASAISAERDSLRRDYESTTQRLEAARFEARRYNDELENYERMEEERRKNALRRQEERRRSAERGVVDGMGRSGMTMEERVRMRKEAKMGEAERVGDALGRLGGPAGAGMGGSRGPGGGMSGNRGPGGGMGVSEKPDAFFGQASKPVTRSTSNIREEERLKGLQKKAAPASGGQGPQQQRYGPMVAERPAVVKSQPQVSSSTSNAVVESKASTADVEREMAKLKTKYEAEIDRLKSEMMQIADKSQSEQLKELVNNHRKELERVKVEMEMATEERLYYELSMLQETHANEMEMMRREMMGVDGPPPFMGPGPMESENQRIREMGIVINNLKEEHAAEVAKLKEEMSKHANYDQSEKMQELQSSHEKAMESLKAEMEAAAASELKSKIAEIEAAHKWQLQNLRQGHDAAMAKSQKEAGDKVRWEVERSIESLKRDHAREIERLKSESVAGVSQSDAMEAMRLNHQAEMESLRAELFGEAARELEEAILSLTTEHNAAMERLKEKMEREAEEQMKRMQQVSINSMQAELQAKTAKVESEQQQDLEQVKQEVMKNANLTESEQIKKLQATHQQEIEELKQAADQRMEEEILKIAQMHAREITKLRDDLEASAANTIRDFQTESARQRQAEIERAVAQMKFQQDEERERIRQDLIREIEQEKGIKVFSQKAEIERLKSDLDLKSKQVMANEITKLKQAHIGEMEQLKRDVERHYAGKLEQLRKDINQKKRVEIEEMKQRQAMELDKISEERSRSSNTNLQRELDKMEEQHKVAMEKLRVDLTAQAEISLKQKIDELTRAHQNEIEELKRSMKAASVAETLRFQTQANVQRTAEVENATQKLKEAHQRELELLRRSMMTNASSSEKERMEVLEASHRAEMERTKAQMEASFAQRLENELNALEQSHQQRLNEVRNELDARSRASADRESLLQSDQAKQLDQMQSEMETLRQSHAAEILTLKSNMLKNSDASYKQQIDELTASFNAELERVKAAAAVGSTTMSGIDQAGIEEILNSLQGVYPPDMIQKLRQDLNAKSAELSRMNKNISDTTTQMNVLQSKLSASEQSQESLSGTIQSLETWKQNAEKDIKAKTDQLQMARAEVERLKNQVGVRAQSSDQVAMLQKDIRAKNNEVVNLTATLQKLTKESAELKAKLDGTLKESTLMAKEINQLQEWRRKAEAEQKKEKDGLESQISRLQQELVGARNLYKQKVDELDSKLRAEAQDKQSVVEKFTKDLRGKDDQIKTLQNDLSSKAVEISSLKNAFQERDKDVSTLVPEVARLQMLNDEMKSINDARLKEFSALKVEAERLKAEFERGNSENLAKVKQLNAKLESEQTKHAEFIARLEQNVKAKGAEIVGLQSTLNDKTKKITDLEKRLGTMSKMSADLAALQEYRSNTEKSIAESKRTIQALQNDLARGKKEDVEKVARIKELERLQESMFGKDGEIQRLKKDLLASGEEINSLRTKLNMSEASNKKMAQDISEFKSARYSSEASLKKTTDELAVAQRDVDRLKREIENIKQSDQSRSLELRDLQRKLNEKESQLNTALASKESEVSSLNRSATSFKSERDRLLAEVEKLSEWKRNAEGTIARQCSKIERINAQIQRLDRDLSGPPPSEYESLLKERASLIEQLARVKNELVQKTNQINTAKSQTEALLRQNFNAGLPPPPGTSIRTVRTPILSNNVVIGEFTSRRRNVATSPGAPDLYGDNVIQSTLAGNPKTPVTQQTPPAEEPKQAEAVVALPPNPPTLSEISSNVAAAITQPVAQAKTSSSNTMSAYDLALAKLQGQSQSAAPVPSQVEKKVAVAEKQETKVAAAPVSGWAGYKDSKWGGYLDNLGDTSSSSTSASSGYSYKDSEKKGFGYLDNLSRQPVASSPAPKTQESKDQYLDSEKKFLLEAKNLALSAAKSFQEAQSKPNDTAALAKAAAEKAKVDELLAKAREMRAKADQIT